MAQKTCPFPSDYVIFINFINSAQQNNSNSTKGKRAKLVKGDDVNHFKINSMVNKTRTGELNEIIHRIRRRSRTSA